MGEGLDIATRLASVAGIILVLWVLYKFEFQIKHFIRAIGCWNHDHKWARVLGNCRQCRSCYKVVDIHEERLTK
jgi:hypothetical protein